MRPSQRPLRALPLSSFIGLVAVVLHRGVLAQNGSNSTPTNTTPVCSTVCCGEDLMEEAYLACMEYGRYQVDDLTCVLFRQNAERACLDSCANCTIIAKAMYDQCVFFLQARGLDDALTRAYCEGTQTDFEQGRCASVCHTTLEECVLPEGVECNRRCGNYMGCDCYRQRGMFGEPDACTGTTVLEADSRQPCFFVPDECKNHRLGTACGKYKHCPVNLCLVKEVVCQITDTCQSYGTCAPGDGECYYMLFPDGSSCDDGLDYTHDDSCTAGVCAGWEDKCLYYQVDCSTSGPCLEPQGACEPQTGACIFQPLPDGSYCDSGHNDTEGVCSNGLCRRINRDLCLGKECPSLGQCYHPSQCMNETGEALCSAVPLPDHTACDDGDAETFRDECLEGRCVGTKFEEPNFKHLGTGMCSDLRGIRVMGYFGEVPDTAACQEACREDPECTAYSFGYHTCGIHGSRRMDHRAEGRWVSAELAGFVVSPYPVAKATRTGDRAVQVECFRKGYDGDKVEKTFADLIHDIIFGIFIALLTVSPAGLFFSVTGRKYCCRACQRRAGAEGNEGRTQIAAAKGSGVGDELVEPGAVPALHDGANGFGDGLAELPPAGPLAAIALVEGSEVDDAGAWASPPPPSGLEGAQGGDGGEAPADVAERPPDPRGEVLESAATAEAEAEGTVA